MTSGVSDVSAGHVESDHISMVRQSVHNQDYKTGLIYTALTSVIEERQDWSML